MINSIYSQTCIKRSLLE